MSFLTENTDALADAGEISVEIGFKRYVAKTDLIEKYDDGISTFSE